MKKKLSLSIMLMSIILILISIETVTARGITEGWGVFYETISPFGNAFVDWENQFEELGIFLFSIGTILLFAPNFILFETSKIKNIILCLTNIIGCIIIFFFYQSCLHMFMMITLCFLIALNILVQFLDTLMCKTNMLVLILTIFILITNIYYLYTHFSQRSLWEMWSVDEMLINDMTHYSQINVICFALWLIPYTILLIKDIISTHKTLRTVN